MISNGFRNDIFAHWLANAPSSFTPIDFDKNIEITTQQPQIQSEQLLNIRDYLSPTVEYRQLFSDIQVINAAQRRIGNLQDHSYGLVGHVSKYALVDRIRTLLKEQTFGGLKDFAGRGIVLFAIRHGICTNRLVSVLNNPDCDEPLRLCFTYLQQRPASIYLDFLRELSQLVGCDVGRDHQIYFALLSVDAEGLFSRGQGIEFLPPRHTHIRKEIMARFTRQTNDLCEQNPELFDDYHALYEALRFSIVDSSAMNIGDELGFCVGAEVFEALFPDFTNSIGMNLPDERSSGNYGVLEFRAGFELREIRAQYGAKTISKLLQKLPLVELCLHPDFPSFENKFQRILKERHWSEKEYQDLFAALEHEDPRGILFQALKILPLSFVKTRHEQSGDSLWDKALKSHDLRLTQAVLDVYERFNQPPPVNQSDRSGQLPLMRAIDAGQRQIVKRLLMSGADIRGLDLTCIAQHEVQWLLEQAPYINGAILRPSVREALGETGVPSRPHNSLSKASFRQNRERAEHGGYVTSNLSGYDFAKTDLKGVQLRGLYAPKSHFNRALLRGSQADWADFRESDLTWVNGRNTSFRGACFRGADLSHGDFRQADFTGADFRDAVLNGANFTQAIFPDALFDGASMNATRFHSANLENAQFNGVSGQGTSFWRADMTGMTGSKASLSGSSFCEADLRGATFTDSNIQGSKFTGAKTFQLRLHNSDISGCNLDVWQRWRANIDPKHHNQE